MTLILTTLQCSLRTRVLWGTTMITPVVRNRPLGFDVLAIKVEDYVGHSNSAVFSTVPVPMNLQQTAEQFARPSVPHAKARQSYFDWKCWTTCSGAWRHCRTGMRSIFCSFMSRTISCELNGDSFAYDLESSPSLTHILWHRFKCGIWPGMSSKKAASSPIQTVTLLQRQLTKINMNSKLTPKSSDAAQAYKIATRIRQHRKNKPDPDLQVLISKLVLPSTEHGPSAPRRWPLWRE